MKLRKTLMVNGLYRHIVQDDVRLFLQAPGRATFVVKATKPLHGIVQFSIGYTSQGQNHLFFTGFIDDCRTVDSKQQRIMCRELTASMLKSWPISLRHPTLRDVLKAYSQKTGLEFIVPDAPYADRPVPCFQALGSGTHGMDGLGQIFGIEDYIWNQQADGRVFVGGWQHSRWASRKVEVSEDWFQKVGNNGNKQIAVVPAIRPGVHLNGHYVTKLQLIEHNMVLTCSTKLNELF